MNISVISGYCHSFHFKFGKTGIQLSCAFYTFQASNKYYTENIFVNNFIIYY